MVVRRLSRVGALAAATSSSQTVVPGPTAPAAGMSSGDAPPIAAATASALASPETISHTSRAS